MYASANARLLDISYVVAVKNCHYTLTNNHNWNVQEKLKDTAKGNKGKIAGLLIEASIYCCVFDISKRGLKKVTENRKWVCAP